MGACFKYNVTVLFLFVVQADDSLMHPPVFKSALNDLTVTDGDSLTLQCTVDGDPDPQVEWYKDGKVR